jgi:hypothetical protein
MFMIHMPKTFKDARTIVTRMTEGDLTAFFAPTRASTRANTTSRYLPIIPGLPSHTGRHA